MGVQLFQIGIEKGCFCEEVRLSYHVVANCFRFLSWEEGFINQPKPRMLMDNFSCIPNFNGTNNMYPFDDESSLIYGYPNQYQTGHIVADMSCLQYAMGEGYAYVLESLHSPFQFYSCLELSFSIFNMLDSNRVSMLCH